MKATPNPGFKFEISLGILNLLELGDRCFRFPNRFFDQSTNSYSEFDNCYQKLFRHLPLLLPNKHCAKFQSRMIRLASGYETKEYVRGLSISSGLSGGQSANSGELGNLMKSILCANHKALHGLDEFVKNGDHGNNIFFLTRHR